MQHDVYIVYHKVKYHRYIGTSRIELRQSMGLYEHRLKQLVANSKKSRIEPFYVPYLAFYIGFFYQLHQFNTFFQCVGQRLLYKQVLAALKHPLGNIEMGSGC